MRELQIGEIAPGFTLSNQFGQAVTLKELLLKSEKGVIVYFYPKASTPGCTTEACDFRDSLNSLKSSGYLVVGVSPDKLSALVKFINNQNLNFDLLSDPEHEVMSAYGAWGEKNNYGKVVVGTIRSTFVIDKEGKIVLAKYRVRAKGHVSVLKRNLGIL